MREKKICSNLISIEKYIFIVINTHSKNLLNDYALALLPLQMLNVDDNLELKLTFNQMYLYE